AGSIAVSAGDQQTATVNTAVATRPAVIVKDRFGNAVAGVAVTFAPALGGGSVTGATPTTNASGIATVGSWTLGKAATANTLTATAGPAARLAITTQPSATVQSGLAFLQQPVIQLQDANGNPVSQSNTTVRATIASGGGTLGGTVDINTNASGSALFTNLSISGTAGPHTLGFSAQQFNPITSATVNVTAGPATQIAMNAGNGPTATT